MKVSGPQPPAERKNPHHNGVFGKSSYHAKNVPYKIIVIQSVRRTDATNCNAQGEDMELYRGPGFVDFSQTINCLYRRGQSKLRLKLTLTDIKMKYDFYL